jgi:hypothetical protein
MKLKKNMYGTREESRPQKSHKWRTSLKLLGYASPLALATALIVAPSASAASYTYANAVSTAENAYHYSGARSLINGGSAETETFAPGGLVPIAYIETYSPEPGYQTHGFASGGTRASMTHEAKSNVHSKCRWDWPWAGGDIGNLDFTCIATS